MDLGSLRMTDDTSWESNGDAVVGIVRGGTSRQSCYADLISL